MLSVGAIIGGPETDFFDTVLREFMQHCEREREWEEADVTVNIVYHLPGSIWQPDYIGVRGGKLSKSEMKLMVQISVEKEWIAERDRTVVADFIFDAADEAIGIAKTRFDKAGIDYRLGADRRFLNRWHDAATG
jgi:hypothetical protein